MRIIKTHELTPHQLDSMSATDTLWTYNGLDCMVTEEVLLSLLNDMDPVSWNTYNFSRSLMGPILEMNMRGVLVDTAQRDKVVAEFLADADRLESNLNRIVVEGIGIGAINPNSPQKIGQLLYDVMRIPEQKKRNAKGEWARTVDEEALNKCAQYFIAEPIVAHILLIRMLRKRASTLLTEVDADGRMRTNFNIGGTNTGRLSSSLGDFGGGGNMQNWEERLRSIFIPDPGMKFGNIDLGQADARNLAAICWELFGIDTYLNACESADLHTTVARMCWPHFDWNDDPKHNRRIADQLFYRHFSYRDMTKKLGHGTNYLVTPVTAQKKTQIPAATVREFQGIYFGAFPEIPMYHQYVRNTLFDVGALTTLHFGRRRYFFGRRGDDSTVREAVAYVPQSMTADEIDTALLRVWRTGLVQLLLQVHDSLLFQFPEEREDEIMPQALEACRVRIPLKRGDREFIVPPDAQTGWNWGKVEKDKTGKVIGNERGLRGWSK